MKLALLLLSVAVLVCAVNSAPVGCENEPEALPKPVDVTARDGATKTVVQKIVGIVQEGSLKTPKLNVIDAPIVCPDGQLLDHQGKCRPILG
uniref:Uncharacterized protein n=1 Tax=Anopheles atroparvus TaxID=41427 RepID=A0AAG5DI59_ANOAO